MGRELVHFWLIKTSNLNKVTKIGSLAKMSNNIGLCSVCNVGTRNAMTYYFATYTKK